MAARSAARRRCRRAPRERAATVHMNPVLLKPQTDTGAQVIVQGRRLGTPARASTGNRKPSSCPRVLESFRRLAADADLVLVEGAGSPAEVNLRAGDIANMGFAEAADVPVVLVGDIDRGGVIAQPGRHPRGARPADGRDDRRLHHQQVPRRPAAVRGRLGFRSSATGWPALGARAVAADAARLPAEDAVALGSGGARPDGGHSIAVPVLPRIANFDDLDPLRLEPDVAVTIVPRGRSLPAMPTWSSCRAPRRPSPTSPALRAEGWDIDIAAHRPARRARARPVRRLPDARADHRRPGGHRRAGAGDVPGLGLSTSRRCSKATRRPSRVPDRHCERHARSPATRCISGDHRARIVRGRCSRLGRGPPGRRAVGRRAGRRDLCPRPVRRRRAARRLARQPRRPFRTWPYEAAVGTARSTGSPTTWRRHLDIDRLVSLALSRTVRRRSPRPPRDAEGGAAR